MLNILEINDFSAPELDIYARRTEAQLLNKDNPEAGLFISYHWKVPSGASIIFFSILIYAVCKIGKSCCRKKS